MDWTAAPAERRLPIRFVGSGSEYFRIWIVNLLLVVVTVGLYYPFAKVRRLRYFHAATEVDGHALAFHGDPWKMLRGFLLVAAMVGAYTVAGRVSPTSGLVAFVIVAALWPALWHASLRFRLANTAWRGIRARFTGSRAGAYGAMAPALAVGFAFVLLGVVAADTAEGGRERGGSAVLAGLTALVGPLAFPALLWTIKRYQHGGYAYAGEQARVGLRLRSLYALGLRTLGIAFLVGAIAGGVAAVFIAVRAFAVEGAPAGTRPAANWAAVLGIVAAYLAFIVVVGSYFTARLQNLVWNATRSARLQFESRLRARDLLWLTVRNWLLMVLTLGLYYPFAKVATARLRLQAVDLVSTVDADTLLAAPGARVDDASGDAAADLLGIDIGL